MVVVSFNQIVEWFKKGRKPSQEQFRDSWYSFWHKHDGVLIKHPTEAEISAGLKTLEVLTLGGNIKVPIYSSSEDAYLPLTGGEINGRLSINAPTDEQLNLPFKSNGVDKFILEIFRTSPNIPNLYGVSLRMFEDGVAFSVSNNLGDAMMYLENFLAVFAGTIQLRNTSNALGDPTFGLNVVANNDGILAFEPKENTTNTSRLLLKAIQPRISFYRNFAIPPDYIYARLSNSNILEVNFDKIIGLENYTFIVSIDIPTHSQQNFFREFYAIGWNITQDKPWQFRVLVTQNKLYIYNHSMGAITTDVFTLQLTTILTQN